MFSFMPSTRSTHTVSATFSGCFSCSAFATAEGANSIFVPVFDVLVGYPISVRRKGIHARKKIARSNLRVDHFVHLSATLEEGPLHWHLVFFLRRYTDEVV